MKNIVITGVSSGIGLACTINFIKNGYKVFGSVRTENDANKISDKINSQNFTPVLLDITHENTVNKAAEKIGQQLKDSGLNGLINNAGIVVSGPLMKIETKKLEQQLQTNVIGTINVCKAFLPLLGAVKNYPLKPGKIINISSVSGKIAYPFLGAYAASKHALEALSDSLRRELLIYGIDVLLVAPASVQTDIWKKHSKEKLLHQYQSSDWGSAIKNYSSNEKDYLSAEQVAKKVQSVLEKRNFKTRFPMTKSYFSGWLIPRYLPSRILDFAIKKILKLRRNNDRI